MNSHFIRRMRFLLLLINLFFLFLLTPSIGFGQSKGSGSSSKSSGTGDGSAGGGGGSDKSGGTQSANGKQDSSSGPRIEASIIAYEASDIIAAHIADQVKGKKVIVYDTQSFAALQTYEAYSATISTLEVAFQVKPKPKEGGQAVPAPLEAAQTVVSTLAALRSSTEYAPVSVDLTVDALVAQIAHKLEGTSSIIVPKFLLLAKDDLNSPDPAQMVNHDCADIDLGVPEQLACLMKVREDNRTNANFTDVDKLFQAFLGLVIGNSTVAKNRSTPAGSDPSSVDQTGTPGQDQSQAPSSVMSLVIQGRRLKAQLTKSSDKCPVRLLVVESIAAGGNYRILHNFWVEVFWRTPTPAFNGGSTVAYVLIDPITSMVEKSEVLGYMFKFSKFKKMHSAYNPACAWGGTKKGCPAN